MGLCRRFVLARWHRRWAVSGVCEPAEQQRGLRGAERECPQLLEHAGMQGEVGLAFQAHSPAGPAQVHDAQPGHLIEAAASPATRHRPRRAPRC